MEQLLKTYKAKENFGQNGHNILGFFDTFLKLEFVSYIFSMIVEYHLAHDLNTVNVNVNENVTLKDAFY